MEPSQNKKQQKKKSTALANSLSLRVTQLRELRNMTVLDLAKITRFPIKRIEEIEAGIELWLSVTDRTILARALVVAPAVLFEVESNPSNMQEKAKKIDRDELAERILAGEVQIPCPKCGKILISNIEDAFDFEGQPTQFARAYCPVCPFAIR